MRQGQKRLRRAQAKLRNVAGGAAGALAGPAWAGSSARAHPKAGAQSCSHPFPWAGEHRFRNSHDSQQPEWPSPSPPVKGTSTAWHSEASMAQKWKLRSSPSPHHLHPLERRGREGSESSIWLRTQVGHTPHPAGCSRTPGPPSTCRGCLPTPLSRLLSEQGKQSNVHCLIRTSTASCLGWGMKGKKDRGVVKTWLFGPSSGAKIPLLPIVTEGSRWAVRGPEQCHFWMTERVDAKPVGGLASTT